MGKDFDYIYSEGSISMIDEEDKPARTMLKRRFMIGDILVSYLVKDMEKTLSNIFDEVK